MPTDTDSKKLSTSSMESKRNKVSKKSKKPKKDKKKKSHKEKKNSHRERIPNDKKEVKPVRLFESEVATESAESLYSAALPPHLIKKTDKTYLVIGPTMPKGIEDYTQKNYNEDSITSESQISQKAQNEDFNVMDLHGPLPSDFRADMSTVQIELEKRALKLKMAAIDGTSADGNEKKVREEWMLELPDVGLKSGLAALNNLKRGFYQGKEKPDFSDRTSWTIIPLSGTNPGPSKTSQENLKSHAQKLYEQQRDAEQEALAEKHRKKNKRDKSLVEIHQKKLRKEEKRKARELKEKGEKPERRPFSRDIDLKLNKIDSHQTKQIVDKAKILNTKFSSGQAKYL